LASAVSNARMQPAKVQDHHLLHDCLSLHGAGACISFIGTSFDVLEASTLFVGGSQARGLPRCLRSRGSTTSTLCETMIGLYTWELKAPRALVTAAAYVHQLASIGKSTLRPNMLLDGNFLAGSLSVQAVSERRRLQVRLPRHLSAHD
jgi:hypothetical protein